MHVGYSRDSGGEFCGATPFSAASPGNGFGSKRLFVNGGNSFSYRFSICNDTLDETATITGITGWARPMLIRGN